MRVPTVKLKNDKTGVVKYVDAKNYAEHMDMWIRKGWSIVGDRATTPKEARAAQDAKPVAEIKSTVTIEADPPSAESVEETVTAINDSIDANSDLAVEMTDNAVTESEPESTTPKRGRGRPRKSKGDSDDNNELQSEELS